jgi:NitT/TauT family transport system substrate-binding protein
MKNFKRMFCFAVLFVCITAALSAGGRRETNVLRIGLMPNLSAVPFLIAQEQGFFADNVRIEIFRSAQERDSALQTGNLDGATSDLLALFLFRQGGFDMIATSSIAAHFGISTHPESGIESLSDMAGRQIALSLNTVIEYIVDRLVSQSGVDPNTLQKVSVPQIASRLELLRERQIDAAALTDPFVAVAELGGLRTLAFTGNEEHKIVNNIVMFTGNIFNNRRSEIVAFYEAYNRAVDFINNTDSSLFMPHLIEIAGLPSESIYAPLPDFPRYDLPPRDEFYAVMRWLTERGVLQQQFRYEDLVRNVHE